MVLRIWWKRNEIFRNYLKVLEYGRKAINELRPNTTFSGGIAWWLSGDAKSGELQYGRGSDLVNKDRLGFIIRLFLRVLVVQLKKLLIIQKTI